MILILTDAPSLNDKEGPWSSKSAHLYKRFVSEAGLKDVVFSYICDDKPIHDLWNNRNYYSPTWYLQGWQKKAKAKIADMKPDLIITCGETALKTLCPEDNVKKAFGYTLHYDGIPVVPTLDPKLIYRERTSVFWVKKIFAKVRKILDGATGIEPNIDIDDASVIAKLKEVIAKKTTTSVDIETDIKTRNLRSFGFSSDKHTAHAIGEYSVHWKEAIRLLGVLLADPEITIIGQNFTFDASVIWEKYKFTLNGPVWDTMQCANMLYAELGHSLADLARLYLHEPMWKGGHKASNDDLLIYNAKDCIYTHMIKEIQEKELFSSGMSDWWEDVNMQLWQFGQAMSIRGILVDDDLRKDMDTKIQAIMDPVLERVQLLVVGHIPAKRIKKSRRDKEKDMEVTIDGLQLPDNAHKLKRADLDMYLTPFMNKKQIKKHYIAKPSDTKKHGLKTGQLYEAYSDFIVELVAQPFNPKSALQVKEVYRSMKVPLPVSHKGGTSRESTDADSMRKILARKNLPEYARALTQSMMLLREAYKLQTSYIRATLDNDSRWRCSYNIEGTVSGRSSSKKTIWGTGGNNQNIPRDDFRGLKFKKVFIPDPGYTIVQADQAAAESRIVAYLADCKPLIESFDLGQDPHLVTLATIYDEKYEDLVKSDPRRQMVKPIAHGYNYQAGPMTIVTQMLSQGIEMSLEEAEELLNLYGAGRPEIAANFHAMIKSAVAQGLPLVTPFGRVRHFYGMHNAATFREAYSYIPQSVVPYITNFVWKEMEATEYHKSGDAQVLYMGHDSLVVQVKTPLVKEYSALFLATCGRIPFDIGEYRDIIMPWDIGSGPNLGEIEDD